MSTVKATCVTEANINAQAFYWGTSEWTVTEIEEAFRMSMPSFADIHSLM